MIFALLQCCCRSTCSLSYGARAGGSVVWMILDACGWRLIWLSSEHVGSFAWRFDRHKCLLPTVKTTQPSTCIYLVGYRLTIDWYGNIYHIYQLELTSVQDQDGWMCHWEIECRQPSKFVHAKSLTFTWPTFLANSYLQTESYSGTKHLKGDLE